MNPDIICELGKCQSCSCYRGAVAETRESFFGDGNWNTSNILMDDVNCNGAESSIQRCHYQYPSNCHSGEGAGVICQPNLGNCLHTIL